MRDYFKLTVMFYLSSSGRKFEIQIPCFEIRISFIKIGNNRDRITTSTFVSPVNIA